MRSVPNPAMACPARLSRPGTTRSLPALIAAAVVLTAMASPAEAKRHHRRGGGGYSPPYAAMVIDEKSGKVRLSRKAALKDLEGQSAPEAEAPVA